MDARRCGAGAVVVVLLAAGRAALAQPAADALTRGLAYEKIGEKAKAAEDFARAKRLGYVPK